MVCPVELTNDKEAGKSVCGMLIFIRPCAGLGNTFTVRSNCSANTLVTKKWMMVNCMMRH